MSENVFNMCNELKKDPDYFFDSGFSYSKNEQRKITERCSQNEIQI